MPKPRIVLLPASKMPKNAVKLTHNILELLKTKDPVINKIISNARNEIEIFHFTHDFINEFKQFATAEDAKKMLELARKYNRLVKAPTKGDRIFTINTMSREAGFTSTHVSLVK